MDFTLDKAQPNPDSQSFEFTLNGLEEAVRTYNGDLANDCNDVHRFLNHQVVQKDWMELRDFESWMGENYLMSDVVSKIPQQIVSLAVLEWFLDKKYQIEETVILNILKILSDEMYILDSTLISNNYTFLLNKVDRVYTLSGDNINNRQAYDQIGIELDEARKKYVRG